MFKPLPTHVKNFLLTSLMFAYSDVLTYFTNVVLARYLGAENFGDYSVAYAVATMLGNIAVLGLGNVSLKVLPGYRSGHAPLIKTFFHFSTTRILTAAGTLAITALAAYELFAKLITHQAHLALFFCFLVIPFFSLSMLLYNLMISLERPLHSILIQTVMRSSLFFLAALVMSSNLLNLHTHHVMLLYGVAILLIDLYYLYEVIKLINLKHPSPKPSTYSREWLQLGLPFIVQTIVFDATKYLSILCLEIFHTSEAEVGIYSACSQLACFVLIFVRGINLLAKPEISRLLTENNIAELTVLIRRNVKVLLGICVLFCFASVLFGKPLLALYGPSFVTGYTPLLVIMVGMLVNVYCSIGVSLVAMSEKAKLLLWLFPLMFLGMLLLNIVFIPYFGMVGAALSLSIPSMLAYGFIIFSLEKSFPFRYRP